MWQGTEKMQTLGGVGCIIRMWMKAWNIRESCIVLLAKGLVVYD